VTDITGVSGRAILGALLQGQTDPQALASLARGRLRKKQEQLKEAVQGTLKDHHRFLLSQQLSHLDMLDAQIAAFDQAIAQRLESEPESTESKPAPRTEASPETAMGNREPEEPVREQTTLASPQDYEGYGQAIMLLDAVTGINERIAQIIVAEIGIEMNRFPSEAHLASWVGLCPGTKISAGKRLSGKIPKGNGWLRQALIEAAHGAARSQGTYLGGLYQRLAKRLGRKKAIVALAHRILVIVYHLLREKKPYQEYGESFASEREQEAMKRQAIRRLEKLGYQVSLEATQVA
jgi:transposase